MNFTQQAETAAPIAGTPEKPGGRTVLKRGKGLACRIRMNGRFTT